jgi:hypothetical protein
MNELTRRTEATEQVTWEGCACRMPDESAGRGAIDRAVGLVLEKALQRC